MRKGCRTAFARSAKCAQYNPAEGAQRKASPLLSFADWNFPRARILGNGAPSAQPPIASAPAARTYPSSCFLWRRFRRYSRIGTAPIAVRRD